MRSRRLPALTPLTRLLVELASRVHGVDHRTTGRTLARMGLAGMTGAEIRHLAEQGFVAA